MKLRKVISSVVALAMFSNNFGGAPIVEASGSPPKTFNTIAGGYSTAVYIDANKIIHFSDGKSAAGTFNSVAVSKEADGKKNYLAIAEDGTLWGYGDNSSGQLGNDSISKLTEPRQVVAAFNAVSVSMGKNFSAAVDSSGGLWCWGDNSDGQLGDGTVNNSTTPVRVDSNVTFKMVSCGSTHAVALSSEGHLYEWGHNASQVVEATTAPTMINSNEQFCFVSCGQNHSAAIDTKGNLWVWGANRYGQLGIGGTSDSYVPVRIESSKFNYVSCGGNFTVAIDSNGNLWGAGLNTSGQLGDGSRSNKTTLTKLTQGTTYTEVNAGLGITCAKASSGDILWCGQGIGDTLKSFDGGIGESELYTIIYDSNDGTGSIVKQTAAYDKTIMLEPYTYLRKGYSFLGWSRTREGSVEFGNNASVTNLIVGNSSWTNSLTLYAQWSKNTYDVTLSEGGSLKATFDEFPENIAVPSKSVTATLDAGQGTLTGASEIEVQLLFKGYYDSAGTQYYDSTGTAVRAWDKDEDTLLTAKWDGILTDFEIPGRSDYTFNGWSEDANADSGATSIVIDKNVKLHAIWVEGTDLVIYNYTQNGGVSASQNQASIPFGADVDLTVAAKKPGWTFVGWNTDPKATASLSSLQMPAAGVILYAIYSVDATAVFTDGSGSRKSTKTLYNNEKCMNLEPLDIRDFNGWDGKGWTTSTSTDGVLDTEFIVEAGKITTFYAVYCRDISISFDYGDAGGKTVEKVVAGTLNAANIGIRGSVTVYAPSTEEIDDLEGWTLIGWTVSESSFDVAVTPGQIASVDRDTTFYAVYTRTVTVTYNTKGGPEVKAQSGIQFYNTVSYRNPSIEVPFVSKEGYSLKSWIVGNNSAKPGDIYEVKADVVFLADWDASTYTIKFDGNGATSGTMSDLVMSYGVAEKLPKNTYSKEFTVSFELGGGENGKLESRTVSAVFEGWEYNDKLYQDHQSVKDLTNVNGSTIVFKARWGSDSFTLPVVTRSGYVFGGWSDGNNVYTGEFTPTANTKLTAVWSADKGTVKIQTGISSKSTVSINPTYGLPMPKIDMLAKTCTVTLNYGALRSNKDKINVAFVLKGIYDQPNGKGTQYYDSNCTSVKNWDKAVKEVTLYAYWVCDAIELPKVESTGYEVGGWYNGTTEVEAIYTPTGDIELTLKVSPCVYTLTLNAKGGSYEGIFDSYTYGKGIILPIPTKENYVFQGWYDSEGVLVEEITSTDAKDFKLNAKWAKVGAPIPNQIGNETLNEYVISSEVEMIPANCFSGCINLRTVTIEEGLLEICSKAFENCQLLQEIVIPESCLFIGVDAFDGCTSLKRIVIKNPACKIVDKATTISKTATVEGWSGAWSEQYARNHNREFVSMGSADRLLVETSDNYTIDYIAAGNHLPLLIDIPTGVKKAQYFLGYACLDGLSDVIESKSGSSSYEGVGTLVYDQEGTLLLNSYIHKGGNITLKAVWSASGMIGDEFVVQGIKYKVSTITNVSVIGSMITPKNINIPAKVSYGGYSYKVGVIIASAFKNCKKLKKVTLGSGVYKIGANAFKGANKLSKVICKGKLKHIGKNAFKGTKNKLKVSTKNSKRVLKKLLKNSGNKTIVVQ